MQDEQTYESDPSQRQPLAVREGRSRRGCSGSFESGKDGLTRENDGTGTSRADPMPACCSTLSRKRCCSAVRRTSNLPASLRKRGEDVLSGARLGLDPGTATRDRLGEAWTPKTVKTEISWMADGSSLGEMNRFLAMMHEPLCVLSCRVWTHTRMPSLSEVGTSSSKATWSSFCIVAPVLVVRNKTRGISLTPRGRALL